VLCDLLGVFGVSFVTVTQKGSTYVVRNYNPNATRIFKGIDWIYVEGVHNYRPFKELVKVEPNSSVKIVAEEAFDDTVKQLLHPVVRSIIHNEKGNISNFKEEEYLVSADEFKSIKIKLEQPEEIKK